MLWITNELLALVDGGIARVTEVYVDGRHDEGADFCVNGGMAGLVKKEGVTLRAKRARTTV